MVEAVASREIRVPRKADHPGRRRASVRRANPATKVEATAARRVARVAAAMARKAATARRGTTAPATTGRRDTARGIAGDRATTGSVVSDRAEDSRAATAEDDRPSVARVASGVRD